VTATKYLIYLRVETSLA